MNEYQELIKVLVVGGCFLLAILLEFALLPHILRIAYKKRLYDLPDSRKIHTHPIPRLGGLSFMPVIVLVLGTAAVARLLYVADTQLTENISNQMIIYILFAMGLMMLYLVGAADDLVGVGYRPKFIVQIVAAILPTIGGLWINSLGGLFGIYELPIYVGIPLTVLLFVYTTNAINLIDGIDGLASGLCIVALSVIATACFLVGHFSMGLLSLTAVGLLCVFFKYNVFNSATHKLFMGDSGSMCLGYIVCLLLVHFWNERPDWDPFEYGWNLVIASTLLIPLFDVVHVVLMRLRHHKNPFLPDKTHIHHRLMSLGLTPAQTLVILLLLSLLIIAVNVVLAYFTIGNATVRFLINVLMWLLICSTTHLTWKRLIAKIKK